MISNINTNSLKAAFDAIPETTRFLGQVALVAAFSLLNLFPGHALRYSAPYLNRSPLVLPMQHILFGNHSPSSYVFKPGMVLGVTATAYSPSVAETDSDPFTTASGKQVDPSLIAANFLPMGTHVQIGPDIYEVGDRMNPRFNDQYRIDMFRPTSHEARSFGTRQLTLEIVSVP